MIGTDYTLAKDFLLKNELVAIPTETVYGLAANALNINSVAKIFEAKNRPTFDPLIVHTHSVEEAKKYVLDFPNWAIELANAFWPGALTLLLPRNSSIPDIVTNGSDLVGIRIPNHPITLKLLQALPFPLAAPSANPFGYISPTIASHVADQLEDKIAYILDGGACKIGLESTIIGIKNGQPAIFRTGGIEVEKIETVLGMKLEKLQSSSNPQAPGMLDSHYAPSKRMYVGDIDKLIASHPSQKIGTISLQKSYETLVDTSLVLSVKGNLTEAASELFAALRFLDKKNIDIIIAEIFPNIGLGIAINDRLKRASAKR